MREFIYGVVVCLMVIALFVTLTIVLSDTHVYVLDWPERKAVDAMRQCSEPIVVIIGQRDDTINPDCDGWSLQSHRGYFRTSMYRNKAAAKEQQRKVKAVLEW